MIDEIEVLLAKSCPETSTGTTIPGYARLVPHVRAVEQAGLAIVEMVGELVLRNLELHVDPWLSRLRRAVRVAALAHDIGKANLSFQLMVRGELSPRLQPVRHELLSAVLLADPGGPVQRWALGLLRSDGQDDEIMLLSVVIGAVGGHHVKLDADWRKAAQALQGGCGRTLKMLLTHRDLYPLFRKAITSHEIQFSLVDGTPAYIGDFRLPFNAASARWQAQLRSSREWWSFAAAVKALVMAADVAGSAILPERTNPAEWVRLALAKRAKATDLRHVVAQRLGDNTLRPFQVAVGESQARVTLVEAGCGSGKTSGAYSWAANHADGKKLFFCYPTTGTATEGYLGYVHETDVEAALIHSRVAADLDGIARVAPDEPGDESLLRIDSLKAWYPEVVVCTTDTVLALVRNNRRGLYNSPAMLSGSFVFDELHALDDRMFEAVIAFAKSLSGASFLLMTASLPPNRKRFLLEQFPDIHCIESPASLEGIRRYEFELLDDENDAQTRAVKFAREGKRVLWICNTVKRAQDRFHRLAEFSVARYAYHSRFKYVHRVDCHRSVVKAFDDRHVGHGAVAVTTQVAEMSLDLDADVLITEIATIPALIQRLGRLNRRVTEENPGNPRTAYFLEPPNPLPYTSADIGAARSWVAKLRNLNRPLSQTDLAQHFQILVNDHDARFELRTEWLDSGWFAVPGPVREPGTSVSVILPEDVEVCRVSVKELISRSIPMPLDQKRNMLEWPRLKGNLIAPEGAITYDEESGAQWA